MFVHGVDDRGLCWTTAVVVCAVGTPEVRKALRALLTSSRNGLDIGILFRVILCQDTGCADEGINLVFVSDVNTRDMRSGSFPYLTNCSLPVRTTKNQSSSVGDATKNFPRCHIEANVEYLSDSGAECDP